MPAAKTKKPFHIAPAAKCSPELCWVSDLMQSCRIEEIPQDDRVKSFSFSLSIYPKITSINKIMRYRTSFFYRHMYSWTHEHYFWVAIRKLVKRNYQIITVISFKKKETNMSFYIFNSSFKKQKTFYLLWSLKPTDVLLKTQQYHKFQNTNLQLFPSSQKSIDSI